MNHNRFLLGNTALLLLAAAFYAGHAKAADLAQGKKLYEANCFACHDSSIHTRKETIIHSLSALKKRVQFCESMNKLGWSDKQKDDVVAYLNGAFYKFK
ncbi:MAG: c-type cytochrome [Pseudomonadota bacterium]